MLDAVLLVLLTVVLLVAVGRLFRWLDGRDLPATGHRPACLAAGTDRTRQPQRLSARTEAPTRG